MPVLHGRRKNPQVFKTLSQRQENMYIKKYSWWKCLFWGRILEEIITVFSGKVWYLICSGYDCILFLKMNHRLGLLLNLETSIYFYESISANAKWYTILSTPTNDSVYSARNQIDQVPTLYRGWPQITHKLHQERKKIHIFIAVTFWHVKFTSNQIRFLVTKWTFPSSFLVNKTDIFC